jgi:hypothetical protein
MEEEKIMERVMKDTYNEYIRECMDQERISMNRETYGMLLSRLRKIHMMSKDVKDREILSLWIERIELEYRTWKEQEEMGPSLQKKIDENRLVLEEWIEKAHLRPEWTHLLYVFLYPS